MCLNPWKIVSSLYKGWRGQRRRGLKRPLPLHPRALTFGSTFEVDHCQTNVAFRRCATELLDALVDFNTQSAAPPRSACRNQPALIHLYCSGVVIAGRSFLAVPSAIRRAALRPSAQLSSRILFSRTLCPGTPLPPPPIPDTHQPEMTAISHNARLMKGPNTSLTDADFIDQLPPMSRAKTALFPIGGKAAGELLVKGEEVRVL